MRQTILIGIVILNAVSIKCEGQTKYDDFGQIMELITNDKEFEHLLFSYSYHGDHPLFVAYNAVVKNSLDTMTYNGLVDWEYGIDLSFADKRIYLRDHGFLFSELIGYYLQFDSISILGDIAIVNLRTNTMIGKQKDLKYFEGQIEFVRRNRDWFIKKKKIRERDRREKW